MFITHKVRRGRVAEYPGYSFESDGKWTDVSGNGYHAVNTNVALTTDHLGRANRALSYVAANSAKTVYNNSLVRNKQKLTVAGWVKCAAGATFNSFTMYNSITDFTGFYITGNKLLFRISDAGENYGFIAYVSAGWNHAIWVYDGAQSTSATRLKLYLNGVAQTLSFTGTIPSVTQDLNYELNTGYLAGTYRSGSTSKLFIGNVAWEADEAVKRYYEDLK